MELEPPALLPGPGLEKEAIEKGVVHIRSKTPNL